MIRSLMVTNLYKALQAALLIVFIFLVSCKPVKNVEERERIESLKPDIFSISPTAGAIAGGTVLTLTGEGFLSDDTVQIAGLVCSSFTIINSSIATCITPANTIGPKSLTMTNSSGKSSTLENIYTYQEAPSLTSVSLTAGYTVGGNLVTVTGSNFLTGITILFDSNECSDITLASSTSLTCTIPAHAAGLVSVTVTNSDSQSETTSSAFTYEPPPAITSITNNAGPLAGGTLITVTGTDFVAGASVILDGLDCTGVAVFSSTSLTCTTPAHAAGQVYIIVTNPDNQSGFLSPAFTFQEAPTLTSVSTTEGALTGGTSVTITGTNFVAGATVLFDTDPCASVSVINSTTMTCSTPAHIAALVNITFTNADGQLDTLPTAYTYQAGPTVGSVSPLIGSTLGSTAITITGTDFQSGATVLIDANPCTSVVFVNPTSITCNTPAHAAGVVTVTVTNPDTQSNVLAAAYTYNAPPTVSSITANAGVLAGGTSITITGSDFVTGATVLFDVSPCTAVAFVSATSLTCTTPVHIAGAVSVTVTNPDTLTGTLASAYTYQAAPVVTSVAALTGFIAGNTAVTITGTGFVAGAAVLFDTDPCTSIVVVSATSITCNTPAHIAGAISVTVTNADLQTDTAAAAFTYIAAPVVTTITNSAGPPVGGTAVTITGTDFVTGATVLFDTDPCTPVGFTSSTTLTCTTPAHLVGAVSVTVTNPDTQSGTTAAAFTYQDAPTVTSVAVNEGALAGGTAITITGTGFVTGAAVLFDVSACTAISVDSSTSITCTTPLHAAGAVSVTVTNADTQTDTLASAYTYQAGPTVSSVAALTGNAIGGTAVTITGTDFVSGATVLFDTDPCTSVVFGSATSLTCTTPAHAAGAVSVTVTNPDTQLHALAAAFTYIAAPIVSSIDITSGALGGATAITITGTDFVSGATVLLDATPCAGVVFGSSTSLTCNTPAHVAGLVSLTVTNPDTQNSILASTYTYQAAPNISSVTPGSGAVAGSTPVTITGTGFLTGAAVLFDITPCTAIVIVSDTSITCTTPGHVAGAVSVTVTNTDTQTDTQAVSYIYLEAPTVTVVSPLTGALAGGTAMTITGTNFLPGATVALGGVDCTSLTVVSATSITCTSGANTAGLVGVTATNTDTQTGTLPTSFTYLAGPTVTGVLPLNGFAVGGTSVTITGINFVSGATILFDATPCAGVAFVSVTSLTCTTPAHAAGIVGVTVTNPDTQAHTLSSAYTYDPAPTVTTVTASSGALAGGTSITITGTNFNAGATVTFDGLACTSINIVSSTSITCLTPAHAAGAVTVAVTNPDTQIGSQAAAYLYLAAPVVSSLSTPVGPIAGGTAMTITGTGFLAGAVVNFGVTACAGVTVVSATSITCTTAAATAGTVSVTVTNTDTQNGSLASSFTYQGPPVVYSASNNAGTTAGGVLITISGTSFVSGATVLIDAGTCSGVSFVNSTSLTCTTPPHAIGAVSITVTNPDTQNHILAAAYTYQVAPTVSSISPITGFAVGGTAVTVTGTNFVTGATVLIDSSACTGLTVVSATSITCTTPAHVSGIVAITATNADTQAATLPASFTYEDAPTVTAIDVNTGSVIGGTNLTLTGTNFLAGATVSVGGASCSSVVVVGLTSITCTTIARASATVDVVVTNTDTQTGTLTNGFTYVSTATLEWQIGVISPNPPNPDPYGSTAVNVTHTYTLKNIGDVTSSTISITKTGISPGAWFFGTDSCSGGGNELAAGASCTIQFTFLGGLLTTGPYSSTLNATATNGGTSTNDATASVP